METKWAKGPWEILDTSILCRSVNDFGNFHIASFGRGDSVLTKQDNANARLIAAAPELAEALMDVIRVLVTPAGFPDKGKGRTKEQQDVYDKARQALRAAGIEV